MKKTITALSMMAAGALFADPTVTTAAISQSADRTVTITYTLSDAPAVVTLDIQTNVTGDAWVSIGGENIQHVTGDVNKKVSGKDTYSIIWRPDFSWQGNSANARAVVTAWPLDNTPDYMVVDLLADKSDNVRYYASTNFLPGGILANRKYRTTSVVMRKILAKGVTWNMGGTDSDDPGKTSTQKTQEFQHEVTLTNNYYIGVFEVTQSQWALVQAEKGNATPSAFFLEGYKAMRPVEQVCYNEVRMNDNATSVHDDAQEWPAAPYSGSFLGRLRDRTDIDFDLPSDAEWEFACRAEHGNGEWNNGATFTSTTEMAATMPGRHNQNGGVDPGKGLSGANATNARASAPASSGTTICGSYAPSDWGLYDMHGNAGEWCLDWYVADLRGTDGSVVTVKSGSNNRVRRSGLGSDGSGACRSAARVPNAPTLRNQYIGFRLACRAGLK